MSDVLAELFRITKPGGIVAFEVGEIRKGSIKLDEEIVPLGETQGFITQYVMINSQEFTKTSNIWGVTNNGSGRLEARCFEELDKLFIRHLGRRRAWRDILFTHYLRLKREFFRRMLNGR